LKEPKAMNKVIEKSMTTTLIAFVCDLFHDKVTEEHATSMKKKAAELHGKDCNESSMDSMAAGDEPTLELQGYVRNSHGNKDGAMFMDLLLNNSTTMVTEEESNSSLQIHLENFKSNGVKEINKYEAFCKAIVWRDMCDDYPSQNFKEFNKKNVIDSTDIKFNPRYIRSMFDVIGWWSTLGSRLFPKLTAAAVIILQGQS